MSFDAFLDPGRFWFLLQEMDASLNIDSFNPERMRKTGCFYGDSLNFFIDTSDGINSDFNIKEYCDRILKIVEECKGKRFIFFKNFYSQDLCSEMIKVAEENNGIVVPFFHWSQEPDFMYKLWPNRHNIISAQKQFKKEYDVGFCSSLEKVENPLPSEIDPRISWVGYNWFWNKNTKDTGSDFVSTRKDMFDLFNNSRFKFYHNNKLPFEEYLKESFKWKTTFSPPGVGEYSLRMFTHGWLGQCVFMRKNTYDFASSWKEYIPEVDFKSKNWEDDLQSIIDNHEEIGDKIRYYLETFCNPKKIVDYMSATIEENYDKCSI